MSVLRRKIIMKLITKIFVSFIFFTLSYASYSEETIRIATGEWAPYISEDLKHYGLISRVVTEAFSLKGVKVEYDFYPWGRALSAANSTGGDASSIWYYHSARDKEFYHSDPVLTTDEVFFHLKSFEFKWNDWSDLQGLSVGSTVEYTVTRMLRDKKEIGKFQLEVVPYDEQNFKKLLAGRIHIFPLAKEVGYAVLNQKFTSHDIQRLTYHPKTVNSGKLYLLFAKNKERSKYMLKLFNQGLKQLKKSGRYDQYFEELRSGWNYASRKK